MGFLARKIFSRT